MTTETTKKVIKKINWLKIILIFLGLILTFGWAIALASFDSLVNLSCTISPQACDQGTRLADTIIKTPLILGSLLLPLGIIYTKKIDIAYKLLIVLMAAVILYYVSFYFSIFLGISLHGLGPS